MLPPTYFNLFFLIFQWGAWPAALPAGYATAYDEARDRILGLD